MRYLLPIIASAFISISTVVAQLPTSTPVKATRPSPTTIRKRVAPKKSDLPQQWPEPQILSEITDQAKLQEGRARELFERSKELLARRKPDDALLLLREAEKLEPKRFEIQLLLGLSLGVLKQNDEAVSVFQNAVKLNPASADAHFLLCKGMADIDKRIDAVDACREAVRLAPTNARFRTQLSGLYLLDDRSQEVIQLLRNVPPQSQNDIVYLGTLGDAYFMAGEYVLAAGIYEKITEMWPKVSLAYLRLSDVYDYLDRPNDAISAAKKVTELEPKFVFGHLNLGKKYQGAGYIDEAITAYNQAISLDAKSGEAYLGLTEMYEITGDNESKLNSLKNAYRLMPRTVPLSLMFGKAMMDDGNAAEAIEPLELANSMRPNMPDVMRALAFAYVDVNRTAEGAAMMERANQISPLPPGFQININPREKQELLERFDELQTAVKSSPSDIRLRHLLARAYRFKGMSKEAEEQYLEIVRLAPSDQNYNGLSVFYVDNRQYEKALEAIRKAIDLNPHHVMYMTMSSTLVRLGRLDDAIVAAEKSVEAKTTSLEARLLLGELLLKKGNRPNALREYQAAFALASGDPRPNFRLAWLYIRMGNKEGALRHYSILKGVAPYELEYLEKSIRGRFGELR